MQIIEQKIKEHSTNGKFHIFHIVSMYQIYEIFLKNKSQFVEVSLFRINYNGKELCVIRPLDLPINVIGEWNLKTLWKQASKINEIDPNAFSFIECCCNIEKSYFELFSRNAHRETIRSFFPLSVVTEFYLVGGAEPIQETIDNIQMHENNRQFDQEIKKIRSIIQKDLKK